MQIEYIKDSHDAKAGDVRAVQPHEAHVLIQLGFAVAHVAQEPKRTKKAV